MLGFPPGPARHQLEVVISFHFGPEEPSARSSWSSSWVGDVTLLAIDIVLGLGGLELHLKQSHFHDITKVANLNIQLATKSIKLCYFSPKD